MCGCVRCACGFPVARPVRKRYRLLQKCPRVDPFSALFLLDERFPDPKLRAFAVRSLDALSDYTLSQLMLQLVQALRAREWFRGVWGG